MGPRPTIERSRPLLVARGVDRDPTADLPLARLPILRAVLRRGFPRVLEASIIPNAIFLVALGLISVGAAMISVVVWSVAALVRRLWRREAIPGLLLLAVTGLAVRTIASMWSGNVAIYFLQPVLTTVAVAGLFGASLVIGQPLIYRLAGDFCPLSADVAARPAVDRLFRQLTLLWAGVNLLTAAATVVLLWTLPLGAFVATKSLLIPAITCSAVAVTVTWSLRTARREDLVFARVVGAIASPDPF